MNQKKTLIWWDDDWGFTPDEMQTIIMWSSGDNPSDGQTLLIAEDEVDSAINFLKESQESESDGSEDIATWEKVRRVLKAKKVDYLGLIVDT